MANHLTVTDWSAPLRSLDDLVARVADCGSLPGLEGVRRKSHLVQVALLQRLVTPDMAKALLAGAAVESAAIVAEDRLVARRLAERNMERGAWGQDAGEDGLPVMDARTVLRQMMSAKKAVRQPQYATIEASWEDRLRPNGKTFPKGE